MWRRPKSLPTTLQQLSRQTNKNFKTIISNSNPETVDYAKSVCKEYDVYFRQDLNEKSCFRRFEIASKLNAKTIIFLDDDVVIPDDFVEKALDLHEPKTYKSWWTWNFNGQPYHFVKDRTRITESGVNANYGGTGISIIDASVFQDKKFFDTPDGAHYMDDIWLSYFVGHVLGWPIQYLDIDGVELGGADDVAEYSRIAKLENNKKQFVDTLRARGWPV
jgi:GT2 family glycosyltransferase